MRKTMLAGGVFLGLFQAIPVWAQQTNSFLPATSQASLLNNVAAVNQGSGAINPQNIVTPVPQVPQPKFNFPNLLSIYSKTKNFAYSLAQLPMPSLPGVVPTQTASSVIQAMLPIANATSVPTPQRANAFTPVQPIPAPSSQGSGSFLPTFFKPFE